MTVVVADTSPLNYLTLIELIDVLPRLYGSVVIPPVLRPYMGGMEVIRAG